MRIQPSDDEEYFYVDIPSKTTMYIICFIGTLFGGLLVLSSIVQLLNSGGPDNFLTLAIGSGILVIVWRYLKVTVMGPRMIISSQGVVLKGVLGTKRWRLNDVTSIVSFPTVVTSRSSGSSITMEVHFLGIKTRSGKVSKFTLPSFVGNEQILKSIAVKMQLTIQDIKDDATFEKWQKSDV